MFLISTTIVALMMFFLSVAHLCKTSKECDHICIPLWNQDKAVTKCLCAAGYQLNEKNKCVKQLSSKFLLLAQSKPAVIKGINVYNKSEDVLSITGLREPRHLDYDVQSNSVIYFDATYKTIDIVSLSDAKELKLLADRIHCTGLAVDWIARNLYFIDGTRRSVKVLNLNKSVQIKTIISDIFDLPISIALDPKNGVLYLSLWSDISPMQGKIYTAYMNGSNYRPFLMEDVHWPISLAIDYDTNRVFWCDQHKQTIESADFHGKNRLIEMKNNLGQPSALAMVNRNEYFVVSRAEGVIKHFKNQTLINTINKTSSDIYDIALFDATSRKNYSNPCSSTTRCHQLCLLTANSSATCACADDYTYDADKNKCVKIRSFVAPPLCPKNHFKCTNEWHCIPNIQVKSLN